MQRLQNTYQSNKITAHEKGFLLSSETELLLDSKENIDAAFLQQLANKCAPILHFHSDEEHKIVSVEWYLKKILLRADKKQSLNRFNLLNAPFSTNNNYHLKQFATGFLKNSKAHGAKPKCYVNIKDVDLCSIDIQYWFLFSGKSGSTANIKWLLEGITGHMGKLNLDPIGCQGGHWERITVRVSKDNFLPTQVFLPNSKGGEWHAFDKMEKEALQPLVFVSKNNHFLYASKGLKLIEFLKFRVFSSALEFSLFDECAEGQQLNLNASIEIISSDFIDKSKGIAPDWLFYQGNWGNPNPNYLNVSKIHDIIKEAFGSNFSFLLGSSVLEKLSTFLIQYYSKDCKCKAQGPQQKKCWQGEELA
ncbi:MAG: Vps62-related protein [Bacteroidota bacterium]